MSKRKNSYRNGVTVSRRDFLKTSVLAAAGAATGGVMGLSWHGKAMAQAPSGTMNLVVSNDLDTYDIHATIAGDAKAIAYHTFEALVNRDYQPQLATSWENPDKLTWILHLKQGVEFSNGEPFDASVVKFNLERIKDPATKARYRGTLAPVESVEVLDKYKVKIQTKTPFSVLVFAMREMFMMSPKAVRELGKDVASKPIGTGPFIVREWVPNEKHILEANPNYHGPKPKVKTLIWRPVAEPSTRIVELRAGTADIIDKIPPELAEGLSGEKLQVIRKRSVYRMGVKLNCSKPPFDKVKARRALNYATDKEALAKHVLRGAGYVTAGYLGPHLGGYDPSLKPYPHDPALAKKLLAEAGYPKGVDIELVSPVGRYLKDKEVMEAVAYQVKEAGFNMKVKALEWGMFMKDFNNSNGYFIGAGYNDPQSSFTEDGDSRVKGFSWVFYHNDEYNGLLDKARETFDVQKRDAIYQSLSKMFWDDATNLWLYDAQDIYGVNSRVKNFSPRSDALILLMDAYVG